VDRAGRHFALVTPVGGALMIGGWLAHLRGARVPRWGQDRDACAETFPRWRAGLLLALATTADAQEEDEAEPSFDCTPLPSRWKR
jgi:hypothetical protein